MWEDWRFRSVSPLLCIMTIACALLQGGWPVFLASLISTSVLALAAFKRRMGYIDVILLGVYSGLLADLTAIGYFCILSGGLGLLCIPFKKTPIPLVTMMGASYSLIINIQ